MKWWECLIEWNDDDDLARAEEKREKRKRGKRDFAVAVLLFVIPSIEAPQETHHN